MKTILKKNLLVFCMLPVTVFALADSVAFAQAEHSKGKQQIQKSKKINIDKDRILIFNGKNLDGLRVLNKSYFEDHGKVHVKGNELILSKGKPGTGISVDTKVHKNLPQMNYEVTITTRRVEGDDFFCGLTFPVNKSYCTLILGGWGGGAIGLSNVDTLSAIENETSGFLEFKNGRWYDIQLLVTEKSLKATLKESSQKKGKVLFDIDPTEHKFGIWWEQEPARPFGLTTWNTTASIKKLQIRKISVKKK